MYYLILFLVCLILVHLAKMLRLYLVLMEHKISFGKFVLLYLKTTLVNLIIPYKIGEVYRFYCISKETKHWQVGVLSIVVDRFFDTLALCMILVPCDIMIARQFADVPLYSVLSDITLVFLVVLLLIAVCYKAILPTYKYLNRYLIKEKSSQRSLAALKGLDVVKEWYDFTQDLISGRFALILASSFVGWIIELITLGVFAIYLEKPFDLVVFEQYIQAIFGMGASSLLKMYIAYSVMIVSAFTVIALVVMLVKFLQKNKLERL